MTIEDLIKRAVDNVRTWNSDDYTFIHSLYMQLLNSSTLTSKQSHVAIKILRKFSRKNCLELKMTKEHLNELLDAPTYDNPPRISVTRRNEVRHVTDCLLAFSGSRNEHWNLFAKNTRANYSEGLLMVQVTSANFDQIIKFIVTQKFEMDSDTEQYLALSMASRNGESELIVLDDKIVINVCDNDVLSAFIIQILDGEIV